MTTVYRRQSMAQLYEKLRAQDDEDDMAWLDQFSPEEKGCDSHFLTAPSPYQSSVSSVSSSSGSSQADDRDCSATSDSSDGSLSSDPDSDGIEARSDGPTCQQESCLPLLFQSDDSIKCSPSPTSASSRGSLRLPHPSPVSRARTARLKHRYSASHASPVSQDDLDEQADTESDGGNSDDEYAPSSYIGPGKRRRSTVSVRRAAEVSRHAKRSRYAPPSRNVQAVCGAMQASPQDDPWACPHCSWVQHNHRTPDLKRHIRTHTRLQRPAQWVCSGVSLRDAGKYQLPEGARPYSMQGKMMIGGCGREFSRRDALKRHLDNEHITCVGDIDAFATSDN